MGELQTHTRETWEVEADDELSGIDFIPVSAEGVGHIAWIVPADPDAGIQDEDRARARLIAAAPELLEALERFLDWPGRFTGGERAEDYAFARRTLAKARAPRAAGYEVK